MTHVSFAIQAHPTRAELAEALAAKIGGPVEIVYDPDPDAEIRSPWRTFRHLLERTPSEATHRLQIQDDTLVCRNFRAAVERAAEAHPDRVLVFFVNEMNALNVRAIRESCQRDLPWAELRTGYWCPVVCSCWPVDLICGLTAFVDEQRWPPKFVADDEICGRFLRGINHFPLASVPSLVEHQDDVVSLVARRQNMMRQAVCWIGDCAECDDASLIDWTLGIGP